MIQRYVRTVGGAHPPTEHGPLLSFTVLKSVMLNSLSLISIYTFDPVVMPLLSRSTQEQWLHHVGVLYRLIWLVPVVGTSLYFNVSIAILLQTNPMLTQPLV